MITTPSYLELFLLCVWGLCVCAGQNGALQVFILYVTAFRQGLLINWSLPFELGWLASRFQEHSHLYLPMLGSHAATLGLSWECWGFKLRSSCPHSKCSKPRAVSPALKAINISCSGFSSVCKFYYASNKSANVSNNWFKGVFVAELISFNIW